MAIIDDVFAGPRIADVKNGLGEFCATARADDALLASLTALTQCDFSAAAGITDGAIATLFKHKTEVAAAADLFLEFDQKLGEVERIRSYLNARGHHVTVFSSVKGLFDGEPFQLVLLDLLLAKGQGESEEIAKQIYTNFKSFIILMSNSPGAAAQEEEFRRRSRLLRGFFQFYTKADLDDASRLSSRLEAMPKNHDVCHAVHEFVGSIDDALGGMIDEEPPSLPAGPGDSAQGRPLARFMHTLRTLGLQDYAILCELTLRDEGQPLGDYMIRLLGFHLIANLLGDTRVRTAVGKLDKMRFTEFLPYGEETSTSFKMLYADSLTERVVEPWSSHPWQSGTTPTEAPPEPDGGAAAPAEAGEAVEPAPGEEVPPGLAPAERESELVRSLGMTDDKTDLPFLQLGDLLIRDESSLVYAVLTASCDLQFTPENVSKARLRERDDTVLLLPGSLRRMGESSSSKPRTTTGLIRWGDAWYSVVWFEGKLLGLPHCVIRTLFQGSGYKHERRLQMGRALELQQNVISHVSRIGLEVQPPLPMDLAVSVYGKQADNTFTALGEIITKGGLLFHLRDKAQPVLVFRKSAFYDLRGRMQDHAQELSTQSAPAARGIAEKMRVAIKSFSDKMVGMKAPVVMPENPAPSPVKHVDNANQKKASSIAQIWFRVGRFSEAPAITNKDAVFCLSVEVA